MATGENVGLVQEIQMRDIRSIFRKILEQNYNSHIGNEAQQVESKLEMEKLQVPDSISELIKQTHGSVHGKATAKKLEKALRVGVLGIRRKFGLYAEMD